MLIDIGRRYERLLFLSAPLTLLSILLLYLVSASQLQDEQLKKKCYSVTIDIFQNNLSSLQIEWVNAQPITEKPYWGSAYKYKLQTTLLNQDYKCYKLLESKVDSLYRLSPTDLITSLKQEFEDSASRPLTYLGIEVPDKASFDLFGTSIKISLPTLIQVLQFTLAPILIIWLSSLYSTRYRETILISKTKNIELVFPHSINAYLNNDVATPRKYTPGFDKAKKFVLSLYTAYRVILLSVYVLPPAASYLIGLFVLSLYDEISYLVLIEGTLVVLFTFAVIALEFSPWHRNKIFPLYNAGNISNCSY